MRTEDIKIVEYLYVDPDNLVYEVQEDGTNKVICNLNDNNGMINYINLIKQAAAFEITQHIIQIAGLNRHNEQ